MDEQVAPDAILQLGLGFWGSKALLTAVELGLFTLLAHGPRTAKALEVDLQLQPRRTRDFLDALVSLGMLEREGEEYRNTAATDLFLDRAKPSYVGGPRHPDRACRRRSPSGTPHMGRSSDRIGRRGPCMPTYYFLRESEDFSSSTSRCSASRSSTMCALLNRFTTPGRVGGTASCGP